MDLLLTNIVVPATATAGDRTVAVIHCAGCQPAGALVTTRGYILQTDKAAIG